MNKTRFWTVAASAAFAAATGAASAQEANMEQVFGAQKLQIDALIGNLTVNVDPSQNGIKVGVAGTQEMVSKLRMTTSGEALVIGMEGVDGDWWDDMWDWSSANSGDLTVHVTVAPGTAVRVDNYMGDAVIADINAPLKFSTNGGEVHIGNVTEAEVAIAGSGDITISTVTGQFEASIAGSGSVRGGDVHSAEIEIAGGGDVTLGAINGALEIDIAGSGEVTAQSVNGKVDIDVAGSGDVRIESGKADPFKVDIAGSGDVRFGGTANNPDVSVMGSGDVWIASYTGTLSSDGADIKIGAAE